MHHKVGRRRVTEKANHSSEEIQLLPTEKRCSICGEVKPREEFRICYRRGQLALNCRCNRCDKQRNKAIYARKDKAKATDDHREYQRVRRAEVLNISLATLEEIRARGRCEICGATVKLVVDHSHRSGRVRGLLCDRCNRGLGFFVDDITLLWRAVDYLLGMTATPSSNQRELFKYIPDEDNVLEELRT